MVKNRIELNKEIDLPTIIIEKLAMINRFIKKHLMC